MDSTFVQARIDKTKLLIVAYEDAITTIVGGGAEEYRLDTGQTVIRVTKLDLGMLNRSLDSLYNRCVTLEARLNGTGTTHARVV